MHLNVQVCYYSWDGPLFHWCRKTCIQVSECSGTTFSHLSGCLPYKKQKFSSFSWYLLLSFFILIGPGVSFFPVDGFNHSLGNFENLGAWFNNKIEGVDKASEWATLNFVSTTAHRFGECCAESFLWAINRAAKKIQILLIAGVSALIIGFSSWLAEYNSYSSRDRQPLHLYLQSGGLAILASLFLLLADRCKKTIRRGIKNVIIVGMNSIFIYLFFSNRWRRFISRIIAPFSSRILLGRRKIPLKINHQSWYRAALYLCYWLYKNKLFIRYNQIHLTL